MSRIALGDRLPKEPPGAASSSSPRHTQSTDRPATSRTNAARTVSWRSSGARHPPRRGQSRAIHRKRSPGAVHQATRCALLNILRAVLGVGAEYEPAVSAWESTWRGRPPVAGTTKAPVGVTYRISRPSGDQRGWNSSASAAPVSGRVGPSPSGRTKTRIPVAVPAAYAIERPSGEKVGSTSSRSSVVTGFVLPKVSGAARPTNQFERSATHHSEAANTVATAATRHQLRVDTARIDRAPRLGVLAPVDRDATQLVGHVKRACPSITGVASQASIDERHQIPRPIWLVLRQRRRLVRDVAPQRRGGPARECLSARDHFVQDGAEGKDVDAPVGLETVQLVPAPCRARCRRGSWSRAGMFSSPVDPVAAVAPGFKVASPKSSSFAPSPVSMTFPGFRSPWTTP